MLPCSTRPLTKPLADSGRREGARAGHALHLRLAPHNGLIVGGVLVGDLPGGSIHLRLAQEVHKVEGHVQLPQQVLPKVLPAVWHSCHSNGGHTVAAAAAAAPALSRHFMPKAGSNVGSRAVQCPQGTGQIELPPGNPCARLSDLQHAPADAQGTHLHMSRMAPSTQALSCRVIILSQKVRWLSWAHRASK